MDKRPQRGWAEPTAWGWERRRAVWVRAAGWPSDWVRGWARHCRR
ncbi:MAG: hypothetical protein M5U34_16345 [Chloroflexi bacterium]|nr:hypothetical protein [Chloroflexota bacterium]